MTLPLPLPLPMPTVSALVLLCPLVVGGVPAFAEVCTLQAKWLLFVRLVYFRECGMVRCDAM